MQLTITMIIIWLVYLSFYVVTNINRINKNVGDMRLDIQIVEQDIRKLYARINTSVELRYDMLNVKSDLGHLRKYTTELKLRVDGIEKPFEIINGKNKKV
jgi:hypothetical protein